MKTRSNMPLYVVVTDNIKALSNSQIDLLRCGDYLVKKTGNERHAYKVAYKDDVKGELALVYCDKHNVEEVYYEKEEGVWTWKVTENSKLDDFLNQTQVDARVKAVVEGATSGTIADVLGLDSEGKLVKGSISGGTKLYIHQIYITASSNSYMLYAITNTQTKFSVTGGPPKPSINDGEIISVYTDSPVSVIRHHNYGILSILIYDSGAWSEVSLIGCTITSETVHAL